MKRKTEFLKPFILGVMVTVLITGGFFNISEAAAKQAPAVSPVNYTIYINGEPTALSESLNVDGKTYVQLREFCEKVKMEVIWEEPNVQRGPIPYGRYYEGITVLNPSLIDSKIMKHSFTKEDGEYINVSGILARYSGKNANLPYSFSENYEEGGYDFLIKENGKETTVNVKTFPLNQQEYMVIDDFKTYILPYWVDMCLANEKLL